MNVLIVADTSDAKAGGSYSLQNAILDEFKTLTSSHRFFVAHPGQLNATNIQSVLDNLGIDFIWSLGPYFFPGKIPFAITVWDIEHRLKPYFPEVSYTGWTFEAREQLYRTALPRATYVVVGTETGKRDIERAYGISSNNIITIPFPALLRRVVEPDPLPPPRFDSIIREPFLFYPAQFWPHKNHIVILEALAHLRQNGFPFEVVFVGSNKGNLDHVLQMASVLGVSSSVHYFGFVSDADLSTLYKTAFCVVFSSVFGPDNLPPLEAMVLGCPVICSDSRGAREQLGEAAMFFNAYDPTSLIEKILSLKEPSIREAFIQKGLMLVANNPPQRYAANIQNALDDFSSIRKLWVCFFPMRDFVF